MRARVRIQPVAVWYDEKNSGKMFKVNPTNNFKYISGTEL